MSTASRSPDLRRFLALALALMAALTGQIAQAGTTSETGITVEIVDEGALTVAWGDDAPTFLVDGQSPALTATTPSVTATATFTLEVADTRADVHRPGYAISLWSSVFTADGSTTPIAPGQISIVDVTGVADGLGTTVAIGVPLDAPVTVLSVPNGAPAVDATLAITVAMAFVPGTMPGNYGGEITFDVISTTGP